MDQLNQFKDTHNIADILIGVFGFSFTIGGLMQVIQAGLAITVAALTVMLLVLRIRKLRREEREAQSDE